MAWPKLHRPPEKHTSEPLIAVTYLSWSTAWWLNGRQLRTSGHVEAINWIGMRWIERRCLCDQILRETEFVRFDGFDDAPGQFVASIVVMVRAIVRSERSLGGFGSPGFIEDAAHGVQIDQWHILFLRHLPYRCGIVAVRICNFSLRIKCAALHRRDQYRNASTFANFFYEVFETCLVRS